MPNFLLETYTLPKNFIELENDMLRRGLTRHLHKNDMSSWIVHKGPKQVLEIIPKSGMKDTLLDYYHYKKYFPCRVTRNVAKPFYMEKRLCEGV